MAYVHIKNEAQRQHEAYVLKSFTRGGAQATSADRDAAQIIAARSREAVESLKKMEGSRR